MTCADLSPELDGARLCALLEPLGPRMELVPALALGRLLGPGLLEPANAAKANSCEGSW